MIPGKHHIGDFLPPDELKKFLEKHKALKEGREIDESDYAEFKLTAENVGFQVGPLEQLSSQMKYPVGLAESSQTGRASTRDMPISFFSEVRKKFFH